MVQQRPLRVETHNFATCSETRVDTHHTLLSQRCRKQQLTQVFGKHANGFFVGFLFALVHEFRLYRGQQQTFVTILNGLCHKTLAGSVATNVVAL